MVVDALLERAHLAVAIALLLVGVVTAWTSTNIAKRMAGVGVATMAALLALAVLRAPTGLVIAGAGLLFAQILVGAGLLVRLQEAYGGLETPEVDVADGQSEPTEPSA